MIRIASCLALMALAVSAHAQAPANCEPAGKARPVCGFRNPEDLAVLPGERALLVSEYGAMEGGGAGALALLVLATDERRVLFRGGDPGIRVAGWGDPGCPGPPSEEFSPHGIDLARRPDGSLALAVIQHGGRESIELFEVTGFGTVWKVSWRGCAIPPPGSWLNEVLFLSDGSLLATHMMPRTLEVGEVMSGGGEPGYALHWVRGQDMTRVPGTEGGLVNGIEVSPDGKKIFLNVTYDGEVRRIDRATGTVEAVVSVPNPDNSTWAPDGKLLVASLRADSNEDFQQCQSLESGFCPIPFAIVAIDPESMEATVRYESDLSVMGGGTVGLQVGDELFVGSFAGDRILRVDLSAE